MGGAGMVDPRVFENVGVDPEEWSGFAFGCGIERVAQLQVRLPRHPRALGGRPPRPDAVLMRVPVSWLRDYVPSRCRSPSWPTRLSVSTAEVEGIERRGVPDDGRQPRALPRRSGRRGRQASECRPAAALPRRRRRGRAASDRLRRVELRRRARRSRSRYPGRGFPGGLQLEQREGARRALGRDDPRRGRGRARQRPLRDHGARRRPSRARRSADVLPLVEDVLLVESTGNRPDLLVDLRHRARGRGPLRRSSSQPAPGSDPEPVRGRTRRGRRSRTSPAARATSAALFRDVQVGAVAGLAQAPGSRTPACARSRTSST